MPNSVTKYPLNNFKTRLFITILLNIIISLTSNAQYLRIKTFTPIPLDLSASTDSRKDNNGEYCALLKVIAPNINLEIQGNVVGNLERKGSEYWCYVTNGTKGLKIIPTSYEPIQIKFEDYGLPAVIGKKTYSLIIDELILDNLKNLSQDYRDIKLRNYRVADYTPESDLWMAIACELNNQQVYYSHNVWMSMNEEDKNKHTVLGVLLPTESSFTIVSHMDEGSHMYRWKEAIDSFGERLPSEQDCYIISHSTIPLCECLKLDQAMIDYGGEPLSGVYWGWEDGNKSRYNLEKDQAVVMMITRNAKGEVEDADNGWNSKTEPAKVRLVTKIK